MTPANFPASPETSAVNKVRLTTMKNRIRCWKFGKPCNGGAKEKELDGEMRERQNQILMLGLLVLDIWEFSGSCKVTLGIFELVEI